MKQYFKVNQDILSGVGSRVRYYTSGSSSTSTSVDPYYNTVMAGLAVKNQKMVNELYNVYKYGAGSYTYEDVAPVLNKKGEDISGWYNEDGSLTVKGQKVMDKKKYEIDPTTGKMAIRRYGENPDITSQMELEQMMTEANASVLPAQTELEKMTLAEQQKATQMSGVARQKLFDTTMAGTDITGAANRAQADVEQGSGLAMQSAKNQAFRNGVDPNSGQFMNLQNQLLTNKAKGIAGARTQARTSEEDKNWERLAALSTYGL